MQPYYRIHYTMDQGQCIVFCGQYVHISADEIVLMKVFLLDFLTGSDVVDWLYLHLEGFTERRQARKYAANMLRVSRFKCSQNLTEKTIVKLNFWAASNPGSGSLFTRQPGVFLKVTLDWNGQFKSGVTVILWCGRPAKDRLFCTVGLG